MVRPGADWNRVTGIPSRSRIPARKSAALVTSPGGFDVFSRTYDCSVVTASFATDFQSGVCAAAAGASRVAASAAAIEIRLTYVSLIAHP
jgi:hypothetical protein